MSHDGFRVERDGAVATITLDVPDKLNRVSMAARGQLAQVFEELGRDEEVRAVVLRGAGPAFTAGGDVAGFLETSPLELSRLHENVAAPERCPKPVIARLHGYVFGVGLELALACDFRLAAEGTELALPEVKLGMIPGSGGTQRLARLIGLGRAKDAIMRGRRIGADEALSLGLVTEVVPEAELDAAVTQLVEELSAFSPLALRTAKQVLNSAYDGPLEAGTPRPATIGNSVFSSSGRRRRLWRNVPMATRWFERRSRGGADKPSESTLPLPAVYAIKPGTIPLRSIALSVTIPTPATCWGCIAANSIDPLIMPKNGASDNQLRTWNHLGLFNKELEEDTISKLPALVRVGHGSASLEARARSYLDANCAQCHRPNGGQVTSMRTSTRRSPSKA